MVVELAVPTVVIVEVATEEGVQALIGRAMLRGIEPAAQVLFVAEQVPVPQGAPGALVALRFREMQTAIAFVEDLHLCETDRGDAEPRIRILNIKRSIMDNVMPLVFP